MIKEHERQRHHQPSQLLHLLQSDEFNYAQISQQIIHMKEKKTCQDSCWCAKSHLTWNLSIHAAHAGRLCKKMDSLSYHRILPEDYLQCPYTAQGSKIKPKSICGYFQRKKLAGAATAPDLILPHVSVYPWKLLCFRNCRADELYHSSCRPSEYLTSRIYFFLWVWIFLISSASYWLM